jgi:beta-glucanase (GH16 family)
MQIRFKPAERRKTRRSASAALGVVLALSLGACLKPGASAEAAPQSARQNGPQGASKPAPLARTPDGRPLKLAFADEFTSFRRYSDGRGGVWRTVYKDGRSADPFELRTLKNNKERQLYVDPDLRSPDGGAALGLNPFQVHDGVLDLIAQPAPAQISAKLGGYGYTSGLITTQPSFAQTYGYFEMRAELPRGKGIWPAFWMLPADLGWPPEIDIMESIGDPGVVYMTAHSSTLKVPSVERRIDPDGFHTFAVSWDPKELIWYVDGREVKRQPTPPDMHKPMYLLANVAVGGGWPGDPDATTRWPARMRIDYIRAYRFAR